MRCISPMTIRHPSKPREFITVPCGKCVYCRLNRANSWAYRLRQEFKNSVSAWFCTLTYRPECLTYNDFGNPILLKDDLKKFFKRLRYYCKKFGSNVRYYGCGEYGSISARPHYHLILFMDVPVHQEWIEAAVADAWKLGFKEITPLCDERIHYTVKYMAKEVDFIEELGLVKPFSLMSLKPAIGSNLLNNKSVVSRVKRGNFVVFDNNHTLWMPRYYINKLLPVNTPSKPDNVSSRIDYKSRKIKEMVQKQVIRLDINNFKKEMYKKNQYDKKHGDGEYDKYVRESQYQDVIQKEIRLNHKLIREI